jgi:uncharacterized protein (TIGR03067 family)
MRVAFLTVVACLVSISAVARFSRGDVGEDELAKLAGMWEVVDVNVDGRSWMTAPGHDAKVMIGPSMTVQKVKMGPSMIVLNKFDSINYLAKLRNLQPSASPATVDLTVQENDETVGKFPAVYKLDGDDLQICWWFKDDKKPRPAKLEKGEGLRLLVLKRVKDPE